MIALTSCAGRAFAVFGLARSGLATAEALSAGQGRAYCWDDAAAGREAARAQGFELFDLCEEAADWPAIEALVLAPGVPLTHPEPHPVVRRARAEGVEVIGDTELFFREIRDTGSKARVVGLTGTNGKSTATALTAHLLREAGLKVSVGGNIGEAILGLEPLEDDRHYVIEFSSYQIDLTPTMALDAAALLNITPDHLDRHGSMSEYAGIKGRIFSGLGAGQTAVISVDDRYCRAIADAIAAIDGGFDVRRISVESRLEDGVYGEDGVLHDVRGGCELQRCPLEGIDSLRGRHNWQNGAVAWALACALGVTGERVCRGFSSFAGLAHRLEVVARRGRVLFVNDSKATNADATAHALAAFDNIFWILGGLAKDGGIDDLAPYFGKIRHAYLIGEAAPDFARRLEGEVASSQSGTLDVAVRAAARDAAALDAGEAVVLLSPACASFDQYPSFDKRGDAFRHAVAELSGISLRDGGRN